MCGSPHLSQKQTMRPFYVCRAGPELPMQQESAVHVRPIVLCLLLLACATRFSHLSTQPNYLNTIAEHHVPICTTSRYPTAPPMCPTTTVQQSPRPSQELSTIYCADGADALCIGGNTTAPIDGAEGGEEMYLSLSTSIAESGFVRHDIDFAVITSWRAVRLP